MSTDSSVRCEYDGDSVEILAFDDSGQRENWAGMGETFCGAFGASTFAYVEGPNWAITADSETDAQAIAEDFEGQVRTIECE